MAEIENQITLMRFVSLRNPERSKKKDQSIRFVFHPDNKTGYFFNAVNNRTVTQNKKEVLESASTNFLAIQTEVELEGIDKILFEASDWLVQNRSIAQPLEIIEKVKGFKPLDLKTEVNLWDNLIFKVITDENYYIKDGILQLLVLQNLLKQIVSTDFKARLVEEQHINITKLANAKVVLPLQLFEEDRPTPISTSSKIREKANNNVIVSKEVFDGQSVALSNLTLIDFQNTIEELKKVERKYQKEKKVALDIANKKYQEKITPLLKNYQKEYNRLKREICKIPRPENYDANDFCNQPDIEYPELPEFIFEYPKETEATYLKDNLSENAYYILTANINLEEVDTFQEVYSILDEKSNTEHANVLSKKQFSQKIITIGGAVINLNSIASKTSNISFRICPQWKSSTIISPYITFELPNSSINVVELNYSITKFDGSIISGTTYNSSIQATTITLSQLGNYNQVDNNNNYYYSSFKGEIILSNGITLIFEVLNFGTSCISGLFTEKDKIENPNNDFVPKGFGFRQLGIADYKKIVSHVCCYDAGEVAHIENVMAREIREKVTTKTHRTEVIDFQSSQVETEKLSDSISTERFEMQTEVAKILQEDKQLSAHANYTGVVLNGTLDVGGSYASNISKEESNRQAITQSKEITQRAMERIVSRITTEKTIKVTDEFIEKNKHGFDNTQSDKHVSGVYRFINAKYKNQIFNYGKRLMYEFMVPQPSKLHNLGKSASSTIENAIILEKPTDPRVDYPDFTFIISANYQGLASQYGASVNQYPEQFINIGKSLDYTSQTSNTANTKVDTIRITDEKYISKKVQINFSGAAPGNNTGWGKNTMVTVGDVTVNFQPPSGIQNSGLLDLKAFQNEIPVAIWSTNYLTVNVIVNILCELSPEAITKWKKETFDAIVKGYQLQLQEYNNNLNSAKAEGVKITESNPLFYRQIEQLILRKNCISYLIDDTNPNSKRRFGQKMYNNNATFTNHQVNVSQDMDDYGSFSKFMEQAFEWNLMSYNFYPFYWGNRDDWDELYQSEINDPIFRSFMQAGMCRVIVTVKPGFEDAVMHYMAFGQIWNGGQMPILGDPLYLSIIDEIKEQEYTVEETWETIVPTNLIALQDKGVAIEVINGLPCGDGCEKDAVSGLVANINTLGVVIKE